MMGRRMAGRADGVNVHLDARLAVVHARGMLSREAIKQRARDLGFDLVGITPAAPPTSAARYRQWLADGFHGEMAYLERTAGKRTDLQQVLPGARSVIVVGLNYGTHDGAPGGRALPTARVARYAQGERDYHALMGEKLALLAGMVDGRWYVDTGPVLERDLAQRAGIGFVGKHTNLISRQLGNWFFLGAVLTKLELPADEPARQHCGKCTRCMTACPTDAIVAPYRLDARRCISYLTIELKGSIPVELRAKIGDHVFGCDDCLAVCPWNRFAKPAVTPRQLPPLVELLAWTDQQFADYFRGTPIDRLKRARFLRNVCVVLGNAGEAAALPALERACRDVEPLIREHAHWAIEQIRPC